VLDVHVPGMNGLALQQRLADEGPHIPNRVREAFTDEAARNTAMGSGAILFPDQPVQGSVPARRSSLGARRATVKQQSHTF
jgi:FixJ family two-component response regulator